MEDEERTRLGLYTNEQYKILKLLSAKCGSPGFLERDKGSGSAIVSSRYRQLQYQWKPGTERDRFHFLNGRTVI